MCGIAGIYSFTNSAIKQDELDLLKSGILHRGPDGNGTEIIDSVGLVHTRLSIQDLSTAAHQPMWTEDNQACISYNGEIYNFKMLRRELEKEGVTFTSSGDTEVLLKLCQFYGVEKALPKLNGMFAFAYWDKQQKKLWIARDRSGIKPLYYYFHAGTLYFASEIKALLPFIKNLQPDLPVLLEVLSGGSAWEPATLFKGVEGLSPGCYLELSNSPDTIQQKEFYSILNHIDESEYYRRSNQSFTEVVSEFSEMLRASVEIHSISDAPLATLASGGIDSSLISTLTKSFVPNISLYHADVVGPNSEREYAQIVADSLKLPLVTAQMRESDYINHLIETTFFHETPSAYHPNDVPFQLVAKRAAEDGIKVLLTGEGADELFIGYGLAVKQMLRDKVNHQVKPLSKLMNAISPASRNVSVLKHISTRGREVDWAKNVGDVYHFIKDDVERSTMVNSAVYFKAHLNSLLQRNDRMGMMHGLESRIPFLENHIINYAFNLPVKHKIPFTWLSLLKGHPLKRNKAVVRASAEGILPMGIVKRKKLGFPVSPFDYIKPTSNFFDNGFLSETLEFTNADIDAIYNNCDLETKWNLFASEVFGRIFFRKEALDGLSEKVLALRKTA